MLSSMKILGLLALFFMVLPQADAQDDQQLKVRGRFYDQADDGKLRNTQITVKNTLTGEAFTEKCRNGRYKVYLDYEQKYHLIYARKGYVTKIIEVDTRMVPRSIQRNLVMEIEMQLFKDINGLDYNVFDKPVAKAYFKHTIQGMGWDTGYYRERLEAIEKAKKEAQKTE